MEIWAAIAISAALVIASLHSHWDNPARNIDALYFLAASTCVFDGHSPYNVELFFECWRATVPNNPISSFVFPPQTLVPSLPIAVVDSESKEAIVFGLQGLSFALLCLAAALIHFSDTRLWWQKIAVFAWITLGLTNTGIFSASLTGQPSVAVGAGLAFVAIAIVRKNGPALGFGTILALIKPHLCLAAIAFAWLKSPRQFLTTKVVAVLAGFLLNAWIFILDPSFLQNFLNSLSVHNASHASKLGTPEELFGISGFLVLAQESLTWIVAAGFGVFVIALLAAARAQGRSRKSEALFCVAILAGAFLIPHKSYDFAIYAPVFFLAARQSFMIQALLFAPLLGIWRPAIVEMVSLGSIGQVLGGDLCLLGATLVFAGVAASELRASAR